MNGRTPCAVMNFKLHDVSFVRHGISFSKYAWSLILSGLTLLDYFTVNPALKYSTLKAPQRAQREEQTGIDCLFIVLLKTAASAKRDKLTFVRKVRSEGFEPPAGNFFSLAIVVLVHYVHEKWHWIRIVQLCPFDTQINDNILKNLFPPSPPCSCDICLNYCRRPGWWTVNEAAKAIEAGYASRMMLEIAPEHTFGVLSPAFKGNEAGLAVQMHARKGCTFLHDHLCELYDTGFQPVECRFCYHERTGSGKKCHSALEKDWYSPAGQQLVMDWMQLMNLHGRYGKRF